MFQVSEGGGGAREVVGTFDSCIRYFSGFSSKLEGVPLVYPHVIVQSQMKYNLQQFVTI